MRVVAWWPLRRRNLVGVGGSPLNCGWARGTVRSPAEGGPPSRGPPLTAWDFRVPRARAAACCSGGRAVGWRRREARALRLSGPHIPSAPHSIGPCAISPHFSPWTPHTAHNPLHCIPVFPPRSPTRSGSACWTTPPSGCGRWTTWTQTPPRCWSPRSAEHAGCAGGEASAWAHWGANSGGGGYSSRLCRWVPGRWLGWGGGQGAGPGAEAGGVQCCLAHDCQQGQADSAECVSFSCAKTGGSAWSSLHYT